MNIAFVDTETLGLDPDRHAIWEVGLILFNPARPGSRYEAAWQIQLSDEQIEAGDPIGMEIGRFADRYDASMATSPERFCETFSGLTDGCHLAGNVVSFDEERLRRLLLNHGAKPGWHYHLIDVENLAVGYLAAKGERVALPWKSDALSMRLGVDPESYDRHTALSDAQWALDTYKAITS